MNELKEFFEQLCSSIYSSTVMGLNIEACEGTMEADFKVVLNCVIGQGNMSGTCTVERIGEVTKIVLMDDDKSDVALIDQDISNYFVPGPLDKEIGYDDLFTAIFDDALFETHHGYMGDD